MKSVDLVGVWRSTLALHCTAYGRCILIDGVPKRDGRGDIDPHWQSVSLRVPALGAEPLRFYDLPALRGAGELLSHTERVGFFTTLGFFASWPTNADNSLRVTLNQTLIAALGQGFAGVQPFEYVLPTALDEYETAGNTCYDCRQTLGPMLDILRSSFTTGYGQQQEPLPQQLRGAFSFDGVVAQDLGGAAELGAVLASHPSFAAAWAQKLCHYANGQSCPEQAPEFQRVVREFVDSGLDFGVLVRQLFASPLVTNSRCIAELPSPIPRAARREPLCLTLSSRFEVSDICALQTPETERSELQRAVNAAVQALPSVAMRRGQSTPEAYATPTRFTLLATEAARLRLKVR